MLCGGAWEREKGMLGELPERVIVAVPWGLMAGPGVTLGPEVCWGVCDDGGIGRGSLVVW